MLTHITAALAISLGATDPAFLSGQDVEEAMDAISTSILDSHHKKRHWDPNKMPEGESTRQHLGGYTALATLALLTAGHDAQSSPLREAITYLQSIEPDGTYAVAFRAQVWASLPDRFLPQLQHDVDRLIEAFHWEQGGWDYLCRRVKRIPRVSPSTRHVALLALHAAHERGIAIPKSLLERIEHATIESQQQDGGWSYHAGDTPTGSMTAAGVFSLVLADNILNPKRKHSRRSKARNAAMHKGLAWLDDRFETSPCPGGGRCAKFPMYWLYSLERMALATGRRRLAGRDWLRDATAGTLDRLCKKSNSGSWTIKKGRSLAQLRQRCFALMFLHRGYTPLACAHLRLGKDEPTPPCVPLLVQDLSEQHEQQSCWQEVDLQDSAEAWLEAPMIIVRGAGEPTFIRDHRTTIAKFLQDNEHNPRPEIKEIERIADYLRRGGLLVAMTSGSGFTRSIKHIGSLAAPNARWSRLNRDHPIASLIQPTKQLPRIEALSTPIRPLIVLISGPSQDVMPNLWALATERSPFPRRIEMGRQIPVVQCTGTPYEVVFAADTDDPVETGAADAFASWAKQTGRSVEVQRGPLENIEEAMCIVIQATTHVPSWPVIKRNLRGGATVLVCGPPAVLDPLRESATTAGYPQASARSAQWSTARDLPGCRAVSTPQWRSYSNQSGLATAGLDLTMSTQPTGGSLILAPSDLMHGLLNRPCWGIHGYASETARHLLWNIVVWTHWSHASRTQRDPYPDAAETTHDEALDMGNTWNSRESGALARTLDDTNADRELIHHRHHLTRLQHQGNGVAMADNASTRRPNASPHTLAECP
ncbi:MAG: hypothetical protein P8M32_07530 [Phycisphaerales bacterium]|nr:hypothetical protein [Phycisphaerales bacterium]